MPDPLPIVLLARLAVDVGEQGHGLGKNLLRDAIARTTAAAGLIGARTLVAHALGESAHQFYLHYDFESSVTDPLHLFLLIKDIQAVRAS